MSSTRSASAMANLPRALRAALEERFLLRWPEVAEVVKKILHVYKADGRPWERMSDWIERIGWPGFFEKTGLPFTKYHIDDWRGSRYTLNASAHIRF